MAYNQLLTNIKPGPTLQEGYPQGAPTLTLANEILTPQEVAEYLQITPDTVYRYIREGKLVASKLGRHYRIPRENIELFLLATSTAGGAQMRTFSGQEVAEWLEEDQIDEGTRSTGARLVADLRSEP